VDWSSTNLQLFDFHGTLAPQAPGQGIHGFPEAVGSPFPYSPCKYAFLCSDCARNHRVSAPPGNWHLTLSPSLVLPVRLATRWKLKGIKFSGFGHCLFSQIVEGLLFSNRLAFCCFSLWLFHAISGQTSVLLPYTSVCTTFNFFTISLLNLFFLPLGFSALQSSSSSQSYPLACGEICRRAVQSPWPKQGSLSFGRSSLGFQTRFYPWS